MSLMLYFVVAKVLSEGRCYQKASPIDSHALVLLLWSGDLGTANHGQRSAIDGSTFLGGWQLNTALHRGPFSRHFYSSRVFEAEVCRASVKYVNSFTSTRQRRSSLGRSRSTLPAPIRCACTKVDDRVTRATINTRQSVHQVRSKVRPHSHP